MQMMSAASELRERNNGEIRPALDTALTDLRLALQQAQNS
jgi:hypothetical protein